jgi:ABC-type transporter Mla maintaining outer membrane lipid asymmetry ATPase subunit MlaF
MPEAAAPLVQLRDVVKHYHGLRPLRVRHLDLQRGQSVALVGLDAAMAEVLVNLMTAGSLPDEGDVHVFGEATAAITDRESWVRMLDRFGLVSDRSVLLDQLTAEQNLAIPLSLEVHSLSDALRTDVHRLAEEVDLGSDMLRRRLGELPPAARLRVRLGRALALGPEVLLAEHPTATLSPPEAGQFAATVARISRTRRLATLTITADRTFARAVADEVLEFEAASGQLRPARRWWIR